MDSGHNCKKRNSDDTETGAADSRLDSKKIKKEKPIDRLSTLPDDLIHKILSFVSIQDAVQTMVLSSRYRFIWTAMPCLNFSTEDFPTSRLDFSNKKFSKFVSSYLKCRDSRVDVSSLKLCFHGKVNQPFVKKIMDYVFSHNIQQLEVTCLLEYKSIEFPLSLFRSMSLKNLIIRCQSVSDTFGDDKYHLKAASTLKLPALTTLYLEDVTFCRDDHTDNCAGLLSKCPNLKNLTLKSCETERLRSFSISHPGLSDLTLDDGLNKVKLVNLVAPQLENLTIRTDHYSREHEISAPNLASLAYEGIYPLHLYSTDDFQCLKQADISVEDPRVDRDNDDPYHVVCLLQLLHNVKFLTLNLEIIELLSSSVELISHQPSPFVNLKSLTIYPKKISEWEMETLPKGKVNLSTEVKNYLLGSSPGATLTLFSREEIIAMKDVKLAQKLMTSLQTLLKKRLLKLEQAETKTNRAELENQMNMTYIRHFWENVSWQIEKAQGKTLQIFNCLEEIKVAMLKLPTSKRAEMQACFSSLCAEVETVVNKIIYRANKKCNMEHSHFNVCFPEIASKF